MATDAGNCSIQAALGKTGDAGTVTATSQHRTLGWSNKK
jgi:3-keto-L-gulonate-6-phosphate decarboxylase